MLAIDERERLAIESPLGHANDAHESPTVTHIDQEIPVSHEYKTHIRNEIMKFMNGTASNLGRETHERLRRIIDEENMELTAMESHLNELPMSS